MYEALILDLRERLENFPADGFSLDYCRIRGACEAMEAMNEKLAALQSENVEKDREIERLRLQRPVQVVGNVMALALELAETKAILSRVEAERDAATRTLDGICSQIDNDCWLRKQFCENGDGDLEPCPCPSLREHSGYIDSDDCEGCKFFVNSWHGAQGEG